MSVRVSYTRTRATKNVCSSFQKQFYTKDQVYRPPSRMPTAAIEQPPPYHSSTVTADRELRCSTASQQTLHGASGLSSAGARGRNFNALLGFRTRAVEVKADDNDDDDHETVEKDPMKLEAAVMDEEIEFKGLTSAAALGTFDSGATAPHQGSALRIRLRFRKSRLRSGEDDPAERGWSDEVEREAEGSQPDRVRAAQYAHR